MANPLTLAPSHKGHTKEEREFAARDAELILKDSSPARVALVSMGIVHQAYALFREALTYEVREGWQVNNPELVLQIMAASSMNQALHRPLSRRELIQGMSNTVLPLLGILEQQEREALKEQREHERAQAESAGPAAEDAAVPGGDHGTPPELDGVRGAAEDVAAEGGPG